MPPGGLQVQAYSAAFDGPTALSLPALPKPQSLPQADDVDLTGDGFARINATSAVVGELIAGYTPPQAERDGLAGLASPHAHYQAPPCSLCLSRFCRLRRRGSATTARTVGPDGPGHAAGRHAGAAGASRRRSPGQQGAARLHAVRGPVRSAARPPAQRAAPWLGDGTGRLPTQQGRIPLPCFQSIDISRGGLVMYFGMWEVDKISLGSLVVCKIYEKWKVNSTKSSNTCKNLIK